MIKYQGNKKKERKIILFIWIISLLLSHSLFGQAAGKTGSTTGAEDRQYWYELLYKISYPVIHNLANSTLKKNMPVEEASGYYLKSGKVTYLEAIGRTAAGIAPWLALPDDNSAEGGLRKTLRKELIKGLQNGADPANPDYLNFRTESQPLVDAAFLAHAFLRAPDQLWKPLDDITRKRLVEEFKSLRSRKAGNSNWLLFPAMTETFLLTIGEQYDSSRINEAVRKMDEWYVGDGWYSDGPSFAMDYYNSFVIIPMLLDILKVLAANEMIGTGRYDTVMLRMIRHAEYQERIISPEGTYPPLGRSLTYRVGAFQVLNQVALLHRLPEYIQPAQVRCALTRVMKNQFEKKGVFDSNGWLQLGFAGHQPAMADQYTSTGSLYLCMVGFLALGIPASDKFWTDPATDWTSKKAWSGQPFRKDYKVNY